MSEFIDNPRRAPRVAIRCGARLALRSGGFFLACTADVGPGGCGVAAAPHPLTQGERVFFEIAYGGERYAFAGVVAWSSTTPPWRAGLAFDEGSRGAADALFRRISSDHPPRTRAIDRIPGDAVLTRTPVPGTLRALPREAEILLSIGPGVEARALRDRLGEEWDGCVNAVFALLERGDIELREPTTAPSSDG